MSLFSHPDYDGHELVAFFHDAASGLRAIIAVHDAGPMGMSGGGCRMWPYPDDDAALRDVLRLSRAMSYKLALAGVPAGGAKCVVIGDPARDKSEALLLALGRAVNTLSGRYIMGEDVGTSPADMAIVGRETAFVTSAATGTADTGPATGWGVFVGLRTAAREGLGRADLRGLSVAVQGLGHVGSELCRHLHAAGARLTVADVDERRAREVAERFGAERVDPARVLGLEVDVVSPNALGGVLDEATVARLRCRLVCGGANNQLATDAVAARLAERGVLYAPDFIVNAGASVAAAAGAGGASQDDILAQVEEMVSRTLSEVLGRARRDGVSTHAAAVALARERMAALRS